MNTLEQNVLLNSLEDEVCKRIMDGHIPAEYGLPLDLENHNEYMAWSQVVHSYWDDLYNTMKNSFVFDATDEELEAHILRAVEAFDGYMRDFRRMSLTVPAYLTALVRHLADGPRQMGDVVTQLVIAACKAPMSTEPAGILERIEARLIALERTMTPTVP